MVNRGNDLFKLNPIDIEFIRFIEQAGKKNPAGELAKGLTIWDMLLLCFANQFGLDSGRVSCLNGKGKGFLPGGSRQFHFAAPLVKVAQMLLYSDGRSIASCGLRQMSLGLVEPAQLEISPSETVQK